MATQWKYAVVFLEADERDGTRRPKNRPDLDKHRGRRLGSVLGRASSRRLSGILQAASARAALVAARQHMAPPRPVTSF